MAIRMDCVLACSSRSLSKIRTLASTAMPMVRITPAMPGSVKTAPMALMNPSTSTRFSMRAMLAMAPAAR